MTDRESWEDAFNHLSGTPERKDSPTRGVGKKLAKAKPEEPEDIVDTLVNFSGKTLRKFQKDNGLVPDGLVGPKTLNAIQKSKYQNGFIQPFESVVAPVKGVTKGSLDIVITRPGLLYQIELYDGTACFGVWYRLTREHASWKASYECLKYIKKREKEAYRNEYSDFDILTREYLTHHDIRGMRWGVQKEPIHIPKPPAQVPNAGIGNVATFDGENWIFPYNDSSDKYGRSIYSPWDRPNSFIEFDPESVDRVLSKEEQIDVSGILTPNEQREVRRVPESTNQEMFNSLNEQQKNVLYRAVLQALKEYN